MAFLQLTKSSCCRLFKKKKKRRRLEWGAAVCKAHKRKRVRVFYCKKEKREIATAFENIPRSVSDVSFGEERFVAFGVGSWCSNKDGDARVHNVLLVSSHWEFDDVFRVAFGSHFSGSKGVFRWFFSALGVWQSDGLMVVWSGCSTRRSPIKGGGFMWIWVSVSEATSDTRFS